tara:strand:- start:155 stop:721 length:567 start_codon:yes stop_codon:yes gene_type:complete
MVLIIDNYDSFTFNLAQYLGELGGDLKVCRNDEITSEGVRDLSPEKIVISPGPGRPEDAGCAVEVVREFYKTTPILGVCLGHQAIGYAFGGRIVEAPSLRHGKSSLILHDGKDLFDGVPSEMMAARYHSLCIAEDSLPEELIPTARALDDNSIMALRHRDFPVRGVQFHPESILTIDGKNLLRNFLNS